MKMAFVIYFFTLSAKRVNVLTGCERLHKLNRIYKDQDHLFLADF